MEVVRWNSEFFCNDSVAPAREKKRPVLPSFQIPAAHSSGEFIKHNEREVVMTISEQVPASGEAWNEVLFAATAETVAGFWSEDVTYACLLREDFHSRYHLLDSIPPAFLLERESNN